MIKNTNSQHIQEHLSEKPKSKQHSSLQAFIMIMVMIIINLTQALTSVSALQTPPPLPILPIPTAQQLSWQLSETALLLHFEANTFTEWSIDQDDPSGFNPTSLNATQWVTVAKENGFSRVILNVKHHDGTCLWPSQYAHHSVKSSPWRNGNGDVVGELADAARKAGLQLGIYLSFLDQYRPTYGYGQTSLKYNQYCLGQITELITRYGVVKEVFLDTGKDKETDTEYFLNEWFSLIHQLQPELVISSNFGPDIRWIGNEVDVAGSTCWSLFNRRNVAKTGYTDPRYSGGDPFGPDWVPPACVVSIRPGLSVQSSEAPKSAMTLLDLHYKSVGRNCLLVLKAPVDSSGLIAEEDIQVLREFSTLRSFIFSHNLAKEAHLAVSSVRGGFGNPQFAEHHVLEESIYTYWSPAEKELQWILYLIFQEPVTFNVVKVQEPIHMGQRITRFRLNMYNANGEWLKVISGTTVGYQRLLRFPQVKTRRVMLVIDEARADPLISYLGLYVDPFDSSYFSDNQVLQQNIYSQPQIASI